jgi:hypothetical protein
VEQQLADECLCLACLALTPVLVGELANRVLELERVLVPERGQLAVAAQQLASHRLAELQRH